MFFHFYDSPTKCYLIYSSYWTNHFSTFHNFSPLAFRVYTWVRFLHTVFTFILLVCYWNVFTISHETLILCVGFSSPCFALRFCFNGFQMVQATWHMFTNKHDDKSHVQFSKTEKPIRTYLCSFYPYCHLDIGVGRVGGGGFWCYCYAWKCSTIYLFDS